MPLITTLTDFNKYVTVSSDFDDEKFLKYTRRAERKIVKLIGADKYDEFVDGDPEDPTRELLCEYAANMGLSYALPAFVLNITGHGVFTNATTDSQRAEWWQVKDLNRSLLKFAFEALDDALADIEDIDTELTAGLFVTSADQFDKVYSIGGSFQTFLSLLPFIREVQEQYLKATLGDCFDHAFTKEQKELIRAAVINLALSKAAVSGGFQLESNAMLLKIEVMPWEKVEKLEQSALERFQNDRYNIGMGYLNAVLKFTKELPCYTENPAVSEIRKKPSGLYL